MPADGSSLLFRGVSLAHHEARGGSLIPKAPGKFDYQFHWGEEGATWDSGITYDSTETNAVIRHELLQQGFPTSGISTSPHARRASYYATSRFPVALDLGRRRGEAAQWRVLERRGGEGEEGGG